MGKALHRAVNCGDKHEVLLFRGMNHHHKLASLKAAVKSGPSHIVDELFTAGAPPDSDLPDLRDEKPFALPVLAIKGDHVGGVQLLVDQGAKCFRSPYFDNIGSSCSNAVQACPLVLLAHLFGV